MAIALAEADKYDILERIGTTLYNYHGSKLTAQDVVPLESSAKSSGNQMDSYVLHAHSENDQS